jgi:hypothetical protein
MSHIIKDTNWMNSNISTFIENYIFKHNEIPVHMYWYSPQMTNIWQNSYQKRIFPGGHNQILYKEKGLLCREVPFIRQRLEYFSKVNIFDVAETMGDSSLPMIFELLESENMGKYVPVTPSSSANQVAINVLKRFVANSGLKDLNTDSIVADIEIADFKEELNQVIDRHDKDQINLFTLMNSRLGNSLDPERMLKNLYKSMNEGDYLAILQGLYRSGTENLLVADYKNLYDNWETPNIDPGLMDMLAPSFRIQTYWDETEKFKGIKSKVFIDKPTTINQLEIQAEQSIIMFRSQRFVEDNLRKIITNSGFSLVDIAYDKDMDNGLFFLQK